MQLTTEQTISRTRFEEFLSSNTHILILKGAAGTGKTTLLKEFIKILKYQHRFYRLMAPTGRAALILSERTESDAATIHRNIYSIDKDPEKVEDRWIYGIKENIDPTNTIYFVDEASMIGDVYQDNEMMRFGSGQVLRDLIAYCNAVSTCRKIVFVGDYAQLPPVGQNISPAMDAQYLRREYNLSAQESILTEVVRQTKDSGILSNAHNIRAAIDNRVYNKFKIINHPDITDLNIVDFKNTYNSLICNDEINKSVVLTHSNSQALSYNKIIREMLFGSEQQDVAVGDLLMITRNCYCHDVELFNGTIVRVQDVNPKIEKHIANVGKNRVELNFREITIAVKKTNIRLLILDDFLLDKNGSLSFEQQKALWAHFEQRMSKMGIKPGTDDFKENIKSDPYFNALQCKYGYAITCHKSQGGEWDNVIVSMDTFMGKFNETFFRWAYTAVTRAKRQLWHMQSPHFSAIDQMVVKPIQICSPTKISYYTPIGENWLDNRFCSIQKLSFYAGVEVEENRKNQYQHRIIFIRDKESCELSLWYNKNFYTGKIQILKCSSEKFKQVCLDICKQSLFISSFPFHPKFPFQQELHNHILEIAQETGVGITNIEQKDWQDIYYIKTDADAAYIVFYYNAKHIYSTVLSYSSNGGQDVKLVDFLSRL